MHFTAMARVLRLTHKNPTYKRGEKMNTSKKEYSALFAEVIRLEKADVITTSGFDGDDHIIKRSSSAAGADLYSSHDAFDL